MEYISDRIKKKRLELGLNQRDFAKKLKLTAPSVSQWERGVTEPKGQNLINLCRLFNCSPEWLLKGKEKTEEKPTCLLIPLIPEIRASGGDGAINYIGNEDKEYVAVPEAALKHRNIEKIECIQITGDSMEPMLFDGGIVALDRNERNIRDGKVYIFQQGNVLRVKKLVRTVNGVLIKSVNPEYLDEKLTTQELRDEYFEIIGRVVWVSNNL